VAAVLDLALRTLLPGARREIVLEKVRGWLSKVPTTGIPLPLMIP
jgi:hypothetical protein